jgi:GH25 family lysozyme M1 (1,4-beta-N-acetylmuramidase)
VGVLPTGLSRRTLLGAGLTTLAGGAAAAEPPAGGGSFPIQGIDVSRWQREIDVTRVAAAGIEFCFCKATEGLAHVDRTFAATWPALAEAGLLRGGYHFGRPGVDAAKQADFVYDTVRPATGDLPIVLDLEQDDGRSPREVRAWTETFVTRLRTRMGAPPIIYTGLYFWRDKAGDGDALGCPLWLAAYVDDPAKYVPRCWDDWSFWQYTSKGSVPGVRGHVDRDAWHGDRAALDALRLP